MEQKSIPQLILAGSSCDDIFVIVLFSTFVSMVQGGHASVSDFAAVPVSIILGAALGAVTGCLLSLFFETFLQTLPLYPQQHKAHPCPWLCLPYDSCGNLAEKHSCPVRPSGSCQYGLHSQTEESRLCI